MSDDLRSNPVMDADGIRQRIPLRYPLLLIDRVLSRGPGRCSALKNLTQSDPVFLGHYPARAIYPGSLLMEAMAQCGYFMGPAEGEPDPLDQNYDESYLLSAECTFVQPATPGDTILMEARLVRRDGDLVRYKVDAFVDDHRIATVSFRALLRSSDDSPVAEAESHE